MKYVIKSREKFQEFWLTQGEPHAGNLHSWTSQKDNKFILRFNSEEDALQSLHTLGYPTEEGKDKYYAYVQPDTLFVIKKVENGVTYWLDRNPLFPNYRWNDKITHDLQTFKDIKQANGYLKELWLHLDNSFVEVFNGEVPPMPKKEPKKRTVISYTVTNHTDMGEHMDTTSIAYICTKESSLKRRYLQISRKSLKAMGEDPDDYDHEKRFKNFLIKGLETSEYENNILFIIKSDCK